MFPRELRQLNFLDGSNFLSNHTLTTNRRCHLGLHFPPLELWNDSFSIHTGQRIQLPQSSVKLSFQVVTVGLSDRSLK